MDRVNGVDRRGETDGSFGTAGDNVETIKEQVQRIREWDHPSEHPRDTPIEQAAVQGIGY